jgi:hypothetical protein
LHIYNVSKCKSKPTNMWQWMVLISKRVSPINTRGLLWSWSYRSWFYNYLCNRCRSPLTLWVRIPLLVRCIGYNIMW